MIVIVLRFKSIRKWLLELVRTMVVTTATNSSRGDGGSNSNSNSNTVNDKDGVTILFGPSKTYATKNVW